MEKNMFSINENQYKEMTDEKLIENIKQDDNMALNCLLERYNDVVNMKANKFFMVGAEREDMVQEGMIGLYKAIRDINFEKATTFKAFAELCVTRQIITAIKTATRQKHIPLNTYVSLNKPVSDDESDRTLLDILSSIKVSDPEELIIGQEQKKLIEDQIERVLSDLEKEVFQSYLDGKSYQEIACDLDVQAKSIDNALQRVKRKLEKCLASKEQK